MSIRKVVLKVLVVFLESFARLTRMFFLAQACSTDDAKGLSYTQNCCLNRIFAWLRKIKWRLEFHLLYEISDFMINALRHQFPVIITLAIVWNAFLKEKILLQKMIFISSIYFLKCSSGKNSLIWTADGRDDKKLRVLNLSGNDLGNLGNLVAGSAVFENLDLFLIFYLYKIWFASQFINTLIFSWLFPLICF